MKRDPGPGIRNPGIGPRTPDSLEVGVQRKFVTLAVLSSLAAIAPLHAQCTGNPAVVAVCNRAVDALKAFHPAVGLVIAGGDPVLGGARAFDGFGHFFLSARVNAAKVTAPNPDTAAGRTSLKGVVPAPIVEGGVGLYRGLSSGLLAVDGLVSATLVPTHVVDKLDVDPGATRLGSMALGLGYGARIGIVRGLFPIPSMSISVMRRSLPRVTYGRLAPSALSPGDAFEFGADVQATTWRFVAGYHLALTDLAVGLGFDRYTSHGQLRYYDNPPLNSVATVPFDPVNERQLIFGDAAFHLAAVTIGAELGWQTGENQRLSTIYTDFDPTAGHLFGGVGLRFGF